MKKAIIGKKLGMTQVFTQEGKAIPVTVVEAGPCTVTQVKTTEKDGYEAVQVSFQEVPERKLTKPELGHFKKNELAPAKYLREFRFENTSDYSVGGVIDCGIFQIGNKVDVIGDTKGRGFSGTIQRWNTHRGPMAHGSGYHRGVGSLSANSDPSRVFKNKKMPGQYGCEQVTIKNLEIVRVDLARNLLLIKGGIPGANGSLVIVRETNKG